jgi:hypothetical protein
LFYTIKCQTIPHPLRMDHIRQCGIAPWVAPLVYFKN